MALLEIMSGNREHDFALYDDLYEGLRRGRITTSATSDFRLMVRFARDGADLFEGSSSYLAGCYRVFFLWLEARRLALSVVTGYLEEPDPHFYRKFWMWKCEQLICCGVNFLGIVLALRLSLMIGWNIQLCGCILLLMVNVLLLPG